MKIAISGKMKSGKTTLAESLKHTLYGYEYTLRRISFADPIRLALSMLGITKAGHPDLYRRGAQYIGTDLCRAYDPNWWVQQMDQAIQDRYRNESIVIDDVRFVNEYDWCKENGFILIRLDIGPEEQRKRGAEEGTFYHPSETGLDDKKVSDWDIWLPEQTSVDQRVNKVIEYLIQWGFVTLNG